MAVFWARTWLSENGKVIGAALTVGTGDGGSKGAAFDIDNDADFVGLSVYGSHRLGDFNGKIDIGWMHTTSDLSATAFGMKLDDEVKADAWTVGIGGEYLFEMGAVNIVPHVGIRWTRLMSTAMKVLSEPTTTR